MLKEYAPTLAMEHDIAPGRSVYTCTREAEIRKIAREPCPWHYDSVDPFGSHGSTECKYAGTNDKVAALTGSSNIVETCSLPASTKAVVCDLATDTPIVYAAR